jgi:hypothetical protein
MIKEVAEDEFSKEVADALNPHKKINSGPTSTKHE